MAEANSALMTLLRAIAASDAATASRMLEASPRLATDRIEAGATRNEPTSYYLSSVGHYVYSGDTALHIAAAAYNSELTRQLIAVDADVHAKNRRGAEPLHYAADGQPGSRSWKPAAQAETIARLIGAGADPNATDKNGVMPLHRAVRCRCAFAVRALLDGGADPHARNGSGSTPMDLATRTAGRGGSGSPAARAQQHEIIQLLEQRPTPRRRR